MVPEALTPGYMHEQGGYMHEQGGYMHEQGLEAAGIQLTTIPVLCTVSGLEQTRALVSGA